MNTLKKKKNFLKLCDLIFYIYSTPERMTFGFYLKTSRDGKVAPYIS